MRTVSKILPVIGIAVVVLTAIKCDKDQFEEDLNISIDASTVEITPSSTFNFNVSVLSEMPRSGVTIKYNIKGELDNRTYYERTLFSKSSDNQLVIYGLPRQLWCICTITVTSRDKGDNEATASFRVGFK